MCAGHLFLTIPHPWLFLPPSPPPHQTICPQEGRGDVATSDLVPFYWGPPRRQGLRSQPAHFWASENHVLIWDGYGPSRTRGDLFDFEVGGHDGAYQGRIDVIVPFIGRKNGRTYVRTLYAQPCYTGSSLRRPTTCLLVMCTFCMIPPPAVSEPRGRGGGGDLRNPPTTDVWKPQGPGKSHPRGGGGAVGAHPATHSPTLPPTHPKAQKGNFFLTEPLAPTKRPQNVLPEREEGGGGLDTHPPTQNFCKPHPSTPVG